MNNNHLIMQAEIPYDIIAKYFAGECTDNEKQELEAWKNESTTNSETFEFMKKTWSDMPVPAYEPDVEKALEEVSAKLPAQKKKNTGLTSVWLKIAAVLIVCLGLSGLYLKFQPGTESIITAQGDKPLEIVLPDNSKVVISENSELKYPKHFRGKQRLVKFTGEAFFEITPNSEKPFIIESEYTRTKVVGTAFNLKAHKTDTVVEVFVTEGIVAFHSKTKTKHNQVLVGVGEVGKLNVKNLTLTKEINKDKNFMAWRNGKLTFENAALGHALKTLSAYYGKTFTAPEGMDTLKFNGYFDNMSVQEAKEYMETLLDVSIDDANNRFVLKPNE
jgi:transmembrane sensor